MCSATKHFFIVRINVQEAEVINKYVLFHQFSLINYIVS